MSKAELRVFVASPGGLDEERQAVEEVANNLNSNLGDRLNVFVSVQRFEHRAARAGRPQGQINEWVDRCEVLIAILHRRLGSPSGEGNHTGFSEEFDRAIARHGETGRPVVSLHFKNVDPAEEEDPGEKLKEVLDFRSRIEREHVLLYQKFGTLDQFKMLVYQLLSEEMVELSGPPATADEGSAPSLSTSTDVQVRQAKEPLDTESGIVGVLEAFAEVIRDGESENRLDLDRLTMFATGVARDAEAPGVHLTNRVYLRRKPEEVSLWEADAWFRAYVADHGSSPDESERAVPFALNVGNEGVAELLMNRRTSFIESEVPYLQRGYVRLLAAYALRPDILWVDEGRATAWERIANSTPSLDVIEYWATVATSDDDPIAEALAAAETTSVAELGTALLALSQPELPIDALLATDPKLLLSKRVAQRYEGALPERVSTDFLIELLGRTYLDDRVKRAVVAEVARRDAWTEAIVDDLLGRRKMGFYLRDDWRQTARDLLLRTTNPDVLLMLTKAVHNKPATERPLLLAEFAQVNPLFRKLYLPTAPNHLAQGSLQEHLTLHASDPSFRKDARAALARAYGPTRALVEGLRAQGDKDSLIEFVEERDEAAALTYLARTPQGLNKTEADRLREIVATSGGFAHTLFDVLAEVATDIDIPVLLKAGAWRTRERPERLREILSRGTLTRLKNLLDHDVSEVVIAALEELARRERLPPQTKLRELLRHTDSRVRMAALSLLIPLLPNVADFIPTYVAGGSSYYYNVVCELDRIAAGAPQVYLG